MLFLIVSLITVGLLVLLILMAGIRGFYQGASEEFKRQHGVITRIIRKMQELHPPRRKSKPSARIPKEGAEDIEPES